MIFTDGNFYIPTVCTAEYFTEAVQVKHRTAVGVKPATFALQAQFPTHNTTLLPVHGCACFTILSDQPATPRLSILFQTEAMCILSDGYAFDGYGFFMLSDGYAFCMLSVYFLMRMLSGGYAF